MHSRRVSLAAVLLLIVSLLGGTTGAGAAPESSGSAAPIRLKAAEFQPGLGERPNIPPGLTIAGYAQGQRGYYLVQFAGPVEQAWKDQVAAAGAELIDYIPDFAFKARMTPAEAARVEQIDAVAWVGLFHPAYKLSPELARDGQHLYSIRVERGADAGVTAAAVARSGAQVLGREDQHLLVAADSAQFDAIAQVLDVAWISNFTLPEKHNEYGAGQIMGADTANTNGYDGSTQTVAVADTGLGGAKDGTQSQKANAHPDIPSERIVAVNNWPGASTSCYSVIDDGAVDVDSGHGTHVAGSVLSDGGASGEGKGTAPAAMLVFQAVENWADMKGLCSISYPDGYYLIGLPSDLRQLFQQAYDQGARIHSNSWGSDVSGDYTADSANTDAFIWSNDDMTITFSAGNSGTDANSDGIVDNDSIGSPATAKNVITVGASENQRADGYPCDVGLTYTSRDAYQSGQTCSSMTGQNWLGTYGQRWGADYPSNPIAGDLTAGNKEQMAAFSSRGPTDDGRIKPDVVAPGTWVLSGYSGLHREGYGDPTNPKDGTYQMDGWGMPLNGDYKYFGGTSMSNPLTAGGAAVVRDYYSKAHGLNASAALTKATLINSAVDMQDENNDGADDNDFPIPNVHEGWGRVNLAYATDGSATFVDNTTGIATGDNASHSYEVASGATFKVTLVWSDYASTESAAKNLVNDLDLVVTDPNGVVYRGNLFAGGWSTTGTTVDRNNNVENVYVKSAASGTWTVEVRGYNVPNGPQPFALVVDGAGSSGDGTTNTPPTAAFTYSCTDLSCSFDGSGSIDTDGTISSYSWDFGDGTSGSGATVSHDYASGGTYTATLTTVDDDGASDADSQSVSVTLWNNPPIASFTYTCTDLACDFDGSGSTDSDGTISGYAWNFGDGETATGSLVRHTYSADGTYSVTLTVTDSDGATGTESKSVTVTSPSPATTIHVGDLDGTSTNNGSTWTASVTITIHDANENPVEGATVNWSWGNGASGDGTCTTTSTGQCPAISKGGIRKNTSTVSFTVTGITAADGTTYESTSPPNHDPDGDSDGTTITVLKP